MVKNKNHIVVLNKTDLGSVCGEKGIEICAKTGDGLDTLMDEIGKKAELAAEGAGEDIITNERHFDCLLRSRDSIENALNAAISGVTSDMIAIDVQLAIEAFGEITGQTVSEEIVDRIFHDFCLGK
jgi:tRNA modification GTPase